MKRMPHPPSAGPKGPKLGAPKNNTAPRSQPPLGDTREKWNQGGAPAVAAPETPPPAARRSPMKPPLSGAGTKRAGKRAKGENVLLKPGFLPPSPESIWKRGPGGLGWTSVERAVGTGKRADERPEFPGVPGGGPWSGGRFAPAAGGQARSPVRLTRGFPPPHDTPHD
jgi:hypothetical protein